MIKEIKMLDGTTKYFEETKNGLQEVEEPKKPKGKWCRLPLKDKVLNCHITNNYYKPYYRAHYHHEQDLMFKTEEEAKRSAEIWEYIWDNRKLFTMEEWGNEAIDKYYILAKINYNGDKPYLVVWRANSYQSEPFHFADEPTAQKAIDFIGFDDWCKYVANIYYENENE